MRKAAHKGFLCDQGMVIKDMEKELFGFYSQVKLFGWDMSTKFNAQHNMEVIQDVYDNLSIVDWLVPLFIVRV